MSDSGTMVFVGGASAPPNVQSAADGRWRLVSRQWDQWPPPHLRDAVLAVVHFNGRCSDSAGILEILDELETSPAVAVFMLPPHATLARSLLATRKGRLLWVDEDAGSDELAATFTVAAQLQPGIARLREKLALGQRDHSIKLFNEEMRLAARLQQDFLPRHLPEVGPARFGTLFRPVSWVSGDIYDIVRLDETHVGFYVVDAVGHGLPAALLTMFIKKAIQTKRIHGSNYEIVPPEVTLSELNTDICQQDLSSCHFCTAVHCVLDVTTLTLTYARAGHPAPVLIRANGQIELLASGGGLLGVIPEAHFESHTCQLSPGDRLLLYTDGADDAFASGNDSTGAHPFLDILRPIAGLPKEQLLVELVAALDESVGVHTPGDDVTVLVMDIDPVAVLQPKHLAHVVSQTG